MPYPAPNTVPNLKAWFVAGVGITSAGGLVSQWGDQSGQGNHLKQATGTNQPALQADGSVLFDGVDNFMQCDAFTLNQPITGYMLAKQVAWLSGARMLDGNSAVSGVLFQDTVSPRVSLNAGSSGGSINTWSVGTYGVVSWVINGASSSIQHNNNAPGTGNAGAGNMGGFTFGTDGLPGTNFVNIQAREIVLYSAAHDSVTRAGIINYLLRTPDPVAQSVYGGGPGLRIPYMPFRLNQKKKRRF